MFTKFLAVPLVIATSVVALPSTLGRRATSDVSLADWQSQNLESYWSFRTRYTHLGCNADGVAGTDFYTKCCYPLGASESLSDRPAECKPAECSAPTTSIQSTTPAVVDTSNDEEDDSNLPYCEEGQSEYEDDDTASVYVAPSVDYTPPAVYTPPADSSSAQDQPTQNQPQDTPAPTPTPDNSGNTGSNGNINLGGFATWFYQGGNAGACGQFHGDGDLIAAIDQRRYGYDFSQPSSLCGQRVHIKNPANGNTVEVVIADVCPTCDNENSIDLSLGAFQALADLGVGHMAIEWNFV